ncbi:MAG: DUF3592 domain-containing protein [Bryobacteraceae bacterium]
MTDRGGLRLFGAVFALVGAGLLAGAGWSANGRFRILKEWPVAQATVTQSEVVPYRDSDGDLMHRTVVEFQYTAAGRAFTTPGQSDYSSSSFRDMKRMADRFPKGSVHPIKYNPEDPSDISFTYGYNFGFFFLPLLLGGMGLVFAVTGVSIAIVSFRSRARRKCHACGRELDSDDKFCPSCAAPVSPFA